jgi:Predicted secreted protein
MSEKKIYVISHCLLNPEARVKGIKKPTPFQTADTFGNPKRIIQLPCPETLYLGTDRPTNTKTTLDSADFRKFSSNLFLPFADMIEIFEKDGFEIELIGVSKSPSCGVFKTTVSANQNCDEVINGTGIFFEEIEKELKMRGISYILNE